MRTGLGDFQSHKLSQARQMKGLTKAALSEMIGVCSASVTSWENGTSKPEFNKLHAISQALNQPVHWFTEENACHFQPSNFFYRSLASSRKPARANVKVRLEWLAELTAKISTWIDWPQLRFPENTAHFLSLSDSEIEQFAEATRSRAGVRGDPVNNVVLAIENLGGIVSRAKTGYAKIDAVSSWCLATNRPFVFLANDELSSYRSRFDTAHELGHLVLHKQVTPAEHKNYHEEIERQANLFASAFLMPESLFAKSIHSVSLSALLALKQKWKVSVAVMITRIHHLEMVSDEQKLDLFKELATKKWRFKEPLDDDLPFEIPRVLPRAVKLICDQIMNKPDFLAEMGLSASTCETLLSLPDGYLNQTQAENIVELKPSYSKVWREKPADVVRFAK